MTAAAPRVPETLLDQLAEAGRLVIPVGDLHHQTLFVITRRGNEFSQEALDPCQFVPLIGEHGWADPMVYGAAAAVLVVVSIVATAFPALAAARVDPNVVLRGD